MSTKWKTSKIFFCIRQAYTLYTTRQIETCELLIIKMNVRWNSSFCTFSPPLFLSIPRSLPLSLSPDIFFNSVQSAPVFLYVLVQRNSRCEKFTKWKMALQRPISHWNSDIWFRFSHTNQKHTSICPPKHTHTHFMFHGIITHTVSGVNLTFAPFFLLSPLRSAELYRLIHSSNAGDGCNFNDPNLNRFGEKEMPHFIHAHRK